MALTLVLPKNWTATRMVSPTRAWLGWVDGENVTIEYRFGEGDMKRTSQYRLEMAASKPNVMVVAGSSSAVELRRAGVKIPVIFLAADDPVGSGAVDNLARPGGNFTGFAHYDFSFTVKQLEILKEIAPQLKRVAVLYWPESLAHVGSLRAIEGAASSAGVDVVPVVIRARVDLERAMDEIGPELSTGMIALNYVITNVHRKVIIDGAARRRIPVIYPFSHYVFAGGLVSYGTDPVEHFVGAASYVDRVLRGQKPGDLPVQQPSKFELVINLKTAAALGLTVPQRLLAYADHVIK
jgi:putative ABC transport system substrate-binding protein